MPETARYVMVINLLLDDSHNSLDCERWVR